MKHIILTACLLVIANIANAFTGFYQTIDDKTNKARSIIAVYEYDGGKLAGRIVALYGDDGAISETINNPVRVAGKVKGSPKMVGLDVVWGLERDGNGYGNGRIMDPTSGSIYRSNMWQEANEPDKLRVRGRLGPFGRTQTWNVLQVKDLPKELQSIDVSKWTPAVRD
jgi:uncharacterized protein (DUF2147 family)